MIKDQNKEASSKKQLTECNTVPSKDLTQYAQTKRKTKRTHKSALKNENPYQSCNTLKKRKAKIMALIGSLPCSWTQTILPWTSKTTHSSKMSSFWRTKTGPESQRKSSESSKASEVHSISWAVSLNLRTLRVLWRTRSSKSWLLKRWEMKKKMMILQLIYWVLEEESQRSQVNWICLMAPDWTWSPCEDHQPPMSQRPYSERRASATICNSIHSYASQHRTSSSNLKCFSMLIPLWCKISGKNKMGCCWCLRALSICGCATCLDSHITRCGWHHRSNRSLTRISSY